MMVKRWVVRAPGRRGRLEVETGEQAFGLEGDEVLLEVRAGALNFADVIAVQGLYAAAGQYGGVPFVPGFDVAGVVIACGPEVKTLRIGDEVLGVVRFGGYASHVVARAAYLIKKPRQMAWEVAASLPTAFLTAGYALRLAGLKAGERVLVHSAAGGVGLAACMLACGQGAVVEGVVGRAEKVPVVQEFGAGKVWVGREWQELEQGPYDVVLDSTGVGTLRGGYARLARNGRLIMYGFGGMLRRGGVSGWLRLVWNYLRLVRFHPFDLVSEGRMVAGFNLVHLFEGGEAVFAELMADVLAGLEDGTLKPLPVRVYAFEEVPAAVEELAGGGTVGKLVFKLGVG